MPKTSWNAKQERQYEKIKAACLQRTRCTKKGKKTVCFKTCQRIAAATVNRTKRSKLGQAVTVTTLGQAVTVTPLGRAKTGKAKKSRKLGDCGCSKPLKAK